MPQQTDVFMIGWEYPPHNSGGLGVACEGLTKSLADKNTDIYFTLPYGFSQPVGHMHVLDCSHPDWNNTSTPPFAAYALGTANGSAHKKLDALQLSALPQSEMEHRVEEYAQLVQTQAKQIKKDFTVIHAHDWMSLPAANKVKAATGAPIVAHVHSTEFDRIPDGKGSPYILHTEQMGLQLADKIIAVSYYTKQLLIERYGLPAEKIEVVHNGIPNLSTAPDPGAHHFATHRPTVVFMGRLTMQKGTEFFLNVAQQVLKKLPDALFIVAGDGDLYHELLFKAAAQRLTASVLFSGFVRDQQREKLLDRADLFIMPSVSEPFGLVALEAAQRHTPVIISKQSGVTEVLPSALAIDFWDIDKMSATVIELLENKSRTLTHTTAQLDDLKAVTWDAAATKVKQVYRNVFLGTLD